MNIKSIIMALFCMISLSAFGQKSISIGYSAEQNYTSTAIHDGKDTYVCIAIPESVAKNYVGAQVTQVRYFGAYTTAETTAFVSEVPTITEDKWASKEKFETIRKGQWNTVTLSQPYTVTGKEFYIGAHVYNPNASGENNYVVPLDAGPCEQYGGYFYYNGQWIFLGDTELNYNIMLKGVLVGDNLPATDLVLQRIVADNVVEKGATCGISYLVKSVGTDKITKFVADYTIDGETFSKEVSFPVGIDGASAREFKLCDYTFETKGSHEVTLTLRSPNGQEDFTPENNTANFSINVYDRAEAYKRNVLVENFTGQTCPNCPAGHNRIEYGLENTPGLDGRGILVCHHAGYYPDTFTRPESEELTWFYASNSTYAPAYMLDRTFIENSSNGSGLAQGPVHFPSTNNIVLSDLQKVMDVPAIINVNISGKLDKNKRTLEITANGDCLFESLSGDVRLNVWLIEDGLKGNQSGAGSNYTHNDVFRASATGAWGENFEVAGGKYAKTYTFEYDDLVKNIDNCWICVFVANNDDVNYNNCKVFNSAKVAIADLKDTPEGIKQAGEITGVAKTEIFSLDGRAISRPEKGVNVVRTTFPNGKVETRKVFF